MKMVRPQNRLNQIALKLAILGMLIHSVAPAFHHLPANAAATWPATIASSQGHVTAKIHPEGQQETPCKEKTDIEPCCLSKHACGQLLSPIGIPFHRPPFTVTGKFVPQSDKVRLGLSVLPLGARAPPIQV